MHKLTHILHTFLVGFFFVLFIYAHNIYFLQLNELVFPIAVIFLLTITGLLAVNQLYKSEVKSALFLTGFWLCFFSYGAIYSFTQSQFPSIGHNSVLLPLFCILVAAWLWVLYNTNINLKVVQLANFFALVLIVLPIYRISTYTVKEATANRYGESEASKLYEQANPDTTNLPDIIYLVLDGYGRADKLKENYEFDNSGFISSLKRQGFQVADKSTSNYCRTAVSVASALNLNYIQSLEGYSEEQSYKALDQLSEESVLIHFLKKYGYQLYSFKTGFHVADLYKHVKLLSKEENLFSELTHLIIDATPFRIVENNPFLSKIFNVSASFISMHSGYHLKSMENLRYRSLYPLDSIPEYINRTAPSFIFADIYVGHPPFIYDSIGNFTPPTSYSIIGEGNTFMSNDKNRVQLYKKGLSAQTTFLNKRILSLISKLRQNASRPTIIILQADHGPGAFYHQIKVEATDIHDRFPILSAIYMPDVYTTEIPNDITPVNTWRYILNSIFKTNLPILPNKQFYSGIYTPSKFIEVTRQLAVTPQKTPVLPECLHSSEAHKE